MIGNPTKKTTLTDAERAKRIRETAREIETDNDDRLNAPLERWLGSRLWLPRLFGSQKIIAAFRHEAIW
jgi:hypothetical protein